MTGFDQVAALVEGGVDILFPETTFDTLNLKAAIFAIEELFAERQRRWPVLLSLTITDQSGRTLSGQTLGAAWASIEASVAGNPSVTSESVMHASADCPRPSSATPSFNSAVGEVAPFGVPE